MLTRHLRTLSLILAGCCWFPGDFAKALADEPNTGQDGGAIVGKATVKAERGPLTSRVTANGTLEGESRTEIRVRLKSWPGPLVVEQAAEHGASVEEGDSLLRFEAEKIEQLVRESREDRESSELAIRLAEHELPILKLQLPLDLQAAERAKDQTGEDLRRFLQVEKAHDTETAEFLLRSAEFEVEYARGELEQLEKMYRDKDLTEETEEMILKRYKFSLASAEQRLGTIKNQTEKTLKIALPRREESAKLAAEKADLSWEKSREELPLQLRQKELALEKLRHNDRRAKDKLADLEHDLGQTSIKAPVAGLVYHGRYVRGQWSGPAESAFMKGGTLPANDVVMTIVSRGQMFLHVDIEEKEIGQIEVGQPARISPTISPRRKLNGRVHEVASVPKGGKFEVLIAVTDDIPENLVPGMTASARVVTHDDDEALWVPSSAVFEDADAETFYVYLPGEKPQKQVVKVGLVAGDKTEILEGLKEGDEILAAKP